MVQDAAAVDVVPGPRRQVGDVEEGARHEAYALEAAHLRARLRHGLARTAQVEMDHLAGHARVLHVLRQHDRRIARAAAGDERAQRLRQVARPAEHIVVQFMEAARRAGDQPGLLVRRVALGIGIGFVLGLYEPVAFLLLLVPRAGHGVVRPRAVRGVQPSMSITRRPVACRPSSIASARGTSARGSTSDTWGESLPSRHQVASSSNPARKVSGSFVR